ncbi:hypothetical protein ACE6H2_022312 [Prunus campanulata]
MRIESEDTRPSPGSRQLSKPAPDLANDKTLTLGPSESQTRRRSGNPNNGIGSVIRAFVVDQRLECEERERRRGMKKSSSNAILVLRGLTPRCPPLVHDRIRSRARR